MRIISQWRVQSWMPVFVGGCLLVAGCLGKQPTPYQFTVANYHIRFPSTVTDVRRAYPYAVIDGTAEPSTDVLVDTLRGIQASWRFTTQMPNDSLGRLYGVLITMAGKGDKMDSIQTALERKYGRLFQRLVRREHIGEYESYQPDSSLRVMQINDDVQLTLGRQRVWDGIIDLPTVADNVTLSICYACDEEERERFALKQEIHPRVYN